MALNYPDLTKNIETNDDLHKLEDYLEKALANKEINLLQWEEIYDEAAENMKRKRKEKMLNTVIADSERVTDNQNVRNKGIKKNMF